MDLTYKTDDFQDSAFYPEKYPSTCQNSSTKKQEVSRKPNKLTLALNFDFSDRKKAEKRKRSSTVL